MGASHRLQWSEAASPSEFNQSHPQRGACQIGGLVGLQLLLEETLRPLTIGAESFANSERVRGRSSKNAPLFNNPCV